jgi:hypothetical protein
MYRIMNTRSNFGLACVAVLLSATIGSGCRSTYYAAYEKLGIYKRDLLRKRVIAARNEFIKTLQ